MAGFEWCSFLQVEAQRTENKMTDVVIQQHSSQAPEDGYINVRNMLSA